MTGRRARTFRVIHPKYGEYTARWVRDDLEAVIRAARSWGEQWSKVAREAEIREVEDGR